MFTKSAADITFSDVKDFCREFGEGVRVEYKQEIDIKRHIPKIVSSFANAYGGIFVIGVEADKTNNKVVAIDGIPNSGGIEERILQSALTGIYPAVIPEVIIQNVPDTDNVVVIVRVDESPQAPHAIQNSTRVYIRTGSITQPYELSEIDRIEYMLKRREDSQTTARQILDRTEERIKSLFCTNEPNLTAIARPVFPDRPVIATADIYDFASKNGLVWNNYSSRVAGGFFVSTIRDNDSNFALRNSYVCWELNEYGIVYHRIKLEKRTSTFAHRGTEEHLDFRQIVSTIGELIQKAQSFYKKCEYLGNIEITVQSREVFGEKLGFYELYNETSLKKFDSIKRQQCLDSQVLASTQCFPIDLMEREKFIGIVDQLAGQLLWAFNIDNPTERKELVKRILERRGLST